MFPRFSHDFPFIVLFGPHIRLQSGPTPLPHLTQPRKADPRPLTPLQPSTVLPPRLSYSFRSWYVLPLYTYLRTFTDNDEASETFSEGIRKSQALLPGTLNITRLFRG